MVPLSYTPGPPGACLCPAGREQIEGEGHGILAYLQLYCLAQGQEKEREEPWVEEGGGESREETLGLIVLRAVEKQG